MLRIIQRVLRKELIKNTPKLYRASYTKLFKFSLNFDELIEFVKYEAGMSGR